jgi:hypothetical protein
MELGRKGEILDLRQSDLRRIGKSAKEFLASEDMIVMLTLIRREYGSQMVAASDQNQREKLYQECKALDRLVGALNEHAANFMKDSENG